MREASLGPGISAREALAAELDFRSSGPTRVV